MTIFMWGSVVLVIMGISMVSFERAIAYGVCLGLVLGVGQAWMLHRAIDRWSQGRARSIGTGMRFAVHGVCIALFMHSAIDIAWWAVCIGVVGVPMIIVLRAFVQLSQK